MKIKIVRLFLMFVLILSSARAQISIGAVGGISMGAVKAVKIPGGFTNAIEGKNIHGFEAGIYVKQQLGPLYIKPELLYRFQSGNVSYMDASTNSSHTVNFSTRTLELPVLFGIRILILNIEAGPVYNYAFKVTDMYNSNQISIERNGMGYRVGTGVMLNRLSFNINYQHIVYNGGSDKATFQEPYQLIFGAGIRF